MGKMLSYFSLWTLTVFAATFAHPISEDLSNIRARRQIITTDVGNCGGNHSNVVGGREKRQIVTQDVLNCDGNHANKVARGIKDSIATHIVVKNTQAIPAFEYKGASFDTISNRQPPQANANGDGQAPGILGDSGNTGGTHQNNIAIGGIQNFGGMYNDLIAKLTADANNNGGSHSNNVAIGGILNFP